MKLASLEEIRDDLGFDDMTDINEEIGAALGRAEQVLSAELSTTFARGQQTDTFFVPEPQVIDGNRVQTNFRLSRGFLVSDPISRISHDPSQLDSAPAGEYMFCKRELGEVRNWVTRFYQQFVQFTYDYGFEADQSDATSYDLNQVPAWLQEAAKLCTVVILNGMPRFKQHDIELDVKTAEAQLRSIISAHRRYSTGVLPL